MDLLLRYIQLVIGVATLFTLAWGVLKVVKIAEKGVDDHRYRLNTLESQVANMNLKVIDFVHISAEISARLNDSTEEIRRVRDRLDKFLDSQARHRELET
jgi:hypothetical protein